MATIGSVLSYEDIVDLRNEGKSDDEIRAYAKAKLAYQKSPEYVAAKRLDDFHKNELKQAFDSGAKGATIDALRARQNIQKARLIGGASADELQDAANFAGKLQEQAIKQERYKDANALERYYYGGVENVNGMIAGLAKIPMKAAEVLDKRINQYQKNIAQGKETETHAKNLASKVGGFLADSWRSEMFKNLYNNANDIAKNYKARNEAWEQEHPDEWNISRLAGEFVNDPLNLVGGKLIAQGAKQGFKKLGANALEGAAIGGVMSVPHASYHSENLSDFAKGVGLGAGIGAVVQPSLVWAGDKIANRAAKKIANENGLNSNTAPNSSTQNSSTQNTTPNTQNSNTAPNSNADDLATNGIWLDYGNTTPPNGGLVRGDNFVTDPKSAKAMNANEIAANEAEILGSGKSWAQPKGELVPIKTDEIIDLVPDENGVYQVAYNGSSKELAKIATEIAKGDPQSMGAKRLVYIADNLAETATKDAEQKISANIAKIDDDSVELYANNTALLGDIAKKYPMLSKDEQIELANKQILANASAELIEYSKFLNGGKLPNDARLLGKNLGRMILKSLNAGAEPAEIVDMLIKAGISGRNSTAAKALIQTRDINAYNAVMRQGEAELIAELSQNVRVAAKNESLGAILDSAKAKALENDELLKKGVGNQGLDDVINTFKSSKSGKEFEVAENGFGRELLSYDGVAANEEMKRAFLAWEAQEKKADITLNDGRKVVFLEPDEAVQLSYGNSYLYGEKDFEALFARKQAESLEQKLKRLQSHPAYENLLKMRENTKASELKGDTFDGSKPTVFYEPQSERYLRTQGGGGLPNAERSITITKADVAKLRAGKADKALAIKLENNLDALTGDPVASGVIDDLLTRDYHLASAAKKSELVAPKNADEVAGNSRIPSDLLDKTKTLRKAEKNELTDELIQEVIKNDSKLWIENASDEVNAFISSKNTKITAKGSAIKHTLERHGKNSINAKNGQPPISLDDIKNHADIVNTADKRVFSTDKSGHKVLVSGKQINGYYVVVENVSNKTGELKFKTMYKENGKLENNEYFKNSAVLNQQNTGAKSFGASPNNHLDQAFGTNAGNSTPKETKSQGGGGLKRGFSTQALNELMLGLGSGGANAMAEDDPNKKAEAFIKGFLAGFGGAKAAEILAKNAPKLAPQFARASEKMASDFPRLLNDRPDILGGVLGRMNNAKDKFSFIFGGEKALGANKAKLEKARDMAKNGAKDDEIWAKTGWYKDIDGKWKFEINPKGGELNKSAFDNHMAKEKAIEKEISELEKTIDDWENTTAKERVEAREKIDELTQSKNKLSIKLGDFLDDEALYKAYPQFKDTTIKFTSIDGDLGTSFGGKILLNKNMDIAQMKSVLYHELQHEVQYVEDFGVGGTGYFDKAKIKELVEKHPNDTQLKQLYDEIENGWAVDEDNAFNVYQKLAGEAEARNVQARQAMLEKADKEAGRIISMIKDPQKAMAVSRDLANVDDYVKLASGDNTNGAIHINLRHTSDPKKLGYVSDDEISRLGENMRKFLLKHKEPYLKDNKFVYEWVENGNAYTLVTDSRSLQLAPFNRVGTPATNSRSLQLAPFNHTGTPAKDEIITFYSNRNLKTNEPYKFKNPELTWQNATLPNSQLPHPDKTLDIAPNDRIVKYDSGMSASMELEKDLLTSQGRVNTNALLKNASKMPKALSRDEFEAQFNANISGDSYVKTPIGDIKVNVEKAWEHFKKNTYNQDRSDLSGAFIHTLQDPLFIVKQNWKPTASPHTMGQSIAKSQNAKRLMDDRQQEIITQSTIFFKPFSDENGGKYLASFAIDKNGELIQKTFYDIDSLEKIKKMIRTPENNVLYYKNARNQTMGYKDVEAGMRESFSPELKASYDMRDKLLKSTNEVRASLNEKGKAELEKLVGSKDSKLSRDAQIMKTLENAKSNPARYAKLKKLYLDENGKVKDSIGLC